MTLFAPYNPGQTERHRPLGVSWDSKETPECQLMAKARWGLRDHTSSSTALIIPTSQQCIQPGPLNKVKCDPSWLQIFINTFACLDTLNTTPITSQITGFNVHIFSARFFCFDKFSVRKGSKGDLLTDKGIWIKKVLFSTKIDSNYSL